ncbi:2141_t:CDS:2 [Gigaspora margarita]|uniref:2141_t:CDS:1 n=1 Tax=Gigaspora margarita TaxID=4874 RepID=A0ABN7UQ71_GIGMA|nr:2141_t:CDS:2 [Gigaspora margarita]
MSATQPIDTTGTNTATDQMAQTIANMEPNRLLEHTAKKSPTHNNDERPEPPKNLEIVLPPEKTIIPPRVSHGKDLPDMKFLYNNPYLVIVPKLDLCDDQCTTMQQNDPIQNTQNIEKQVKEITIDETHTIIGQRRTVLEDESIYFNFETTESSSSKKEDDMISTTSNTHQHKMDMNIISNATVEKKGKPQLPKDKNSLLENIKATKDAMQIPITEYSKINNTFKWLREKYKYNKIPPYILELPDQPNPD